MSIFQSFINSVLTCDVESAESSYGAGDATRCGAQSETFCDNESCAWQVCKRHLWHCGECGKDYCPDCKGEHRCVGDEPMDPPGWEGGFAENH